MSLTIYNIIENKENIICFIDYNTKIQKYKIRNMEIQIL